MRDRFKRSKLYRKLRRLSAEVINVDSSGASCGGRDDNPSHQ